MKSNIVELLSLKTLPDLPINPLRQLPATRTPIGLNPAVQLGKDLGAGRRQVKICSK